MEDINQLCVALMMLLDLTTVALAAEGDGEYCSANKYFRNNEEGNLQAKKKAGTAATATPEAICADDAIMGVKTIGFVDNDGAKVSAIIVEYSVDLTGAKVSTDLFEVEDYAMKPLATAVCELGSDPGVPLRTYVNDKPEISEAGGSGTGKYVIIEVNTDYQFSSAMRYQMSMMASVQQTGVIKANNCTITPASEKVVNYMPVELKVYGMTYYLNFAIPGTYTINGIEDYELHYLSDDRNYNAAYPAFHATNCFDEATGEYTDVDLPYAIYVPDDYDPAKKYALILHIPDAGVLGTDPMLSLTEAKGPANYASDEVQQILKNQGLGGAIVVAPVYAEKLRTTRDNWSISAGVPATWQLMDYLTETHNIDADRIYGTGQSMGGMQVLAMAAQRDNYFAALWLIGCQWGTNYDMDAVPYQGSTYYKAPADGTLIWTKDADGNPCDYRNLYYLISDDNILINNCSGDLFSIGTWKETSFLYSDLAGVEIPKMSWNPLTDSAETAQTVVQELTAQDNGFGMYWAVMDGGSHQSSWVYAHANMASYEWFLTQTRETEMARDKLDLDKPFVWADEQILSEERLIATDEATGLSAYYVTGQAGSGTADYNSALFSQSGTNLLLLPGWTAENYEDFSVMIPVSEGFH